MGKLFGTDGIRGVANETLDTKLAYRIGQAAAISLQDGTAESRPSSSVRTQESHPTCSRRR